jgi:hypothetical protein
MHCLRCRRTEFDGYEARLSIFWMTRPICVLEFGYKVKYLTLSYFENYIFGYKIRFLDIETDLPKYLTSVDF